MNQYRIRAIKLRKLGYSYGMIRDKLGISKSTLSNWLSLIEFRPNKELLARIGRGKLKSAISKHKIKLQDIVQRKKEAAKEVGKLTKRDLFMLGIGVYLGEGSKATEEVKIANSDPMIIKSTLKWLRDFCGLENKHFRITLHSYPDTNQAAAIKFWSKETLIPIEQFTQTVIDKRQNKSALKRRSLPYGTAHLYVRSGGTIVPGVKSLHRKIIGWIESVQKQI